MGGGSSGVVYQGDCNTVDHLDIGIHLVINILSTLLGASNYIMQSLSAPTRTEIDQVHERGSWLDIGVQSMRNLLYTSCWKQWTWISLAAFSIPLHLFYNSSFFSTLSSNDYSYYYAQGPDMQYIPENNGTLDWECSSGFKNCLNSFGQFSWVPESSIQVELPNWEFLSASDCLQAYAVDFLSDRQNVIVVGNYTTTDEFSIFGTGYTGNLYDTSNPPFQWICSGLQDGDDLMEDCSARWRKIDPSDWWVEDSFSSSGGGSTIDNYWIKAKNVAGAAKNFFNGGINSAILHYVSAPDAEPTQNQTVPGRQLLETDLHPLVNPTSPGGPTIDDIDVAMNLQLFWFSSTQPSIPVLLQIVSGAQPANALLPTGSVYELPLNASIQLTFNTSFIFQHGGPHPFHLHGQAFSVIQSTGSNVDNFVNPVQRDVVDTGMLGDNVTIQFFTSNAGPWFLHCHIDFHLEVGFAIVFAQGTDANESASNPTPEDWDQLCPIYDQLTPAQLGGNGGPTA
ncbi:hypothetical protein BT96DRAFT_989840 [Gymnopus androsaceus JB14]|uniref:Uncharacterized protein n=1 Tax=Gymnopus androsaceus JB14 TaxID=1447944 RepID=A0A6A4HZ75_9AGAR|nr:hypothetical protein BT96DRAFT_989840 [Gymnopus androsaceus JB14]